MLDSSIPEDAETLAELKQWQKPVDELTAEQLGETQVDLDGSFILLFCLGLLRVVYRPPEVKVLPNVI